MKTVMKPSKSLTQENVPSPGSNVGSASTNRDSQVSKFVRAHGGTKSGHTVVKLDTNADMADATNPIPLMPSR